MISDLLNNLPVDRGSSGRAPKQPRSGLGIVSSTHGPARNGQNSLSGSKELRQVCDTSEGGESPTCCGFENRHEENASAQNFLRVPEAGKRAAIRGLHSRIRVLQKASGRTCSIEVSDLYNKAILSAQCDIRILETV